MTARILVVDDAEANVRLLEAKLSAEYYDVLTASDGPSALKVAADQVPDIILLDVMMPGMDGFEVCRRIKSNPRTAHVPVVMVVPRCHARASPLQSHRLQRGRQLRGGGGGACG